MIGYEYKDRHLSGPTSVLGGETGSPPGQQRPLWVYPDQVRFLHKLSTPSWIVPACLAILSLAYIGFEQMVMHGYPLWSPQVLRGALTWALLVPFLVWLVLRQTRQSIQASSEVAFRHRELVTLNAIGDAANHSLELNEVLQTALVRMADLLCLEAGEVWLVEGDQLVLRGQYGIAPAGTHLFGRELTAEQPYHASNQVAGLDSPLSNKVGVYVTATLPMKLNYQVAGVIHVVSRRPAPFSRREFESLTTIANRMATAAKNARLYEETRRRAAYMEAASLIGQRILSLLDSRSLLDEAAHLIRHSLAYRRCHLFLVDRNTNELDLKAASRPEGEPPLYDRLRLAISKEGIAGWVAYTGQTMLCNDVRPGREAHHPELAPETRSQLVVPLRMGNRIIGVLDVQSDQVHAFDKQDVTVLQIIGNQLGIAIENARLFRETKRRYKAMVALHHTTLDLLSQLDMTELLDSLLRRGVSLFNAQAGALYRYDSKQDLIYHVAQHNTLRDLTGLTLRPGEGIVGQMIEERRSLLIENYAQWANKVPKFADYPAMKIMGAPLKRQDEILGGIIILEPHSSNAFDHSDLWLLELFADLVTVAIENADLHTRVTISAEELEQKVQQRTREVVAAKEEITVKAQQLRALLARTTRIAEEERARIARDMHDGVVQLITATRYQLKAARTVAKSGATPLIDEKLLSARDLLDEMEREIRHAIHNLTPPALEYEGLVSSLHRYIDTVREFSGLTIHFQVVGSATPLSSLTEITVFRLVEESLYNVVKHACATVVSVTLDFQDGFLTVIVEDNGQGFDPAPWRKEHSHEHLGLLSMHERVEDLGGNADVLSAPGQGTIVRFTLPAQP